MVDDLAALGPTVDAEPITALGQTPGFADRARRQEAASEELGVARLHRHDRAHVALGHDEQMDRRLRIDVLECEHRVVLVLDVAGRLARDDAAEHAVRHEAPPEAPAIIAPPRSAGAKGARMGTWPKCKRKSRKNGNNVKLGSTWDHKA